jgi:hypothetical protein
MRHSFADQGQAVFKRVDVDFLLHEGILGLFKQMV